MFAHVLLAHIQLFLDKTCRPHQSGFTAGRSTIDAILVLCLLSELHCEFDRPINVSYLDIKAAFDSVDWRALWKARCTGVPDFLIDLIAALHENTGAQVRSRNNLSNGFHSTSGVRQGCILAPALFLVAIDWIFNHMSTPGICVGARRFTDLVYADDTWRLSTWSANAKYARFIGRTIIRNSEVAARTDLGKGIISYKTPSEFCLRSHCQAFGRYASTPSTPVSCWSHSRPPSWAQLEASSRSSEQPMDRPAPQERQWHTTSWPVEKIHHALLYGSDATVLDDYALTMTTSSYSALEVSPFMCYMLYITAYLLAIFLVHTVSGLDLQQWPRRHIQWTVGINHSIWLPCRRQILFSGSRRRRNAAVFCLKLSIIIVVVIVVARSRRNL